MNRMAYIAREPGQPGAIGYINAESYPEVISAHVESWIERGMEVQKVPLHQAIEALKLHAMAQRTPTPDDHLPMMLLPQAD